MKLSPDSIKILKTDEVKENLESKGIRDEDLIAVIYHGESTGEKVYIPEENIYLSSKRILKVRYYVEYSIENDEGFRIHNAYFHKAYMESELEGEN